MSKFMSNLKGSPHILKISVLIILALVFNNLYLIHQRALLKGELNDRIEKDGQQIIDVLATMKFDSFIYAMEMSQNEEISDDFLLQTKERIDKNIRLVNLLNLRHFGYILTSMREVIEMYENQDSYSKEQLGRLLYELHYDLDKLMILFLDLEQYGRKPFDKGGNWSTDYKLAYNRAHGLDREFYVIEKEFMEKLVAKYYKK